MLKSWKLPILVILCAFAFLYFAPAFQTTENATVYFDGCRDESCALHGDLRTNVWTRDYELSQADGSVLIFPPSRVQAMSWPVPKDDSDN